MKKALLLFGVIYFSMSIAADKKSGALKGPAQAIKQGDMGTLNQKADSQPSSRSVGEEGPCNAGSCDKTAALTGVLRTCNNDLKDVDVCAIL